VNPKLLLVLVVLLVALYGVAVGVGLSRDDDDTDPERAPAWIEDGLAGLMLPFAKRIDPQRIPEQQGSGWTYDPSTGRLRIEADDTLVRLELPRDPDPDADDEDFRAATLRQVVAVGGASGPITMRVLVEGDEEPERVEGDLKLAVPRDGAVLEIRADGPRTLEFVE